MIFSEQLIFSRDQAVTASAPSTNVIDWGANGTVHGDDAPIARDKGPGFPVPILVQVVEDFAGLDHLTITLQSSDNENFSGDPETVILAHEVPVADLVAGWRTSVRILPDFLTGRYIRVHYGVAEGPATAGRVTAGFVMAVQTNE